MASKVANGILANYNNKTKIIFSNSLEFWDEVDYIYQLENGTIIKEGNASYFINTKRKPNKY